MINMTALILAALAVGMIVTQAYMLLTRFLRLLLMTYFRKISVYGINNLPREGPVIICPNHPNMFVDALLVITECTNNGRAPFAWVKGSAFNSFFGKHVLSRLGTVPVYRPRRSEDSLADVDCDMTPEEIEAANKRMFQKTWEVLAAGNVMVLFPEGTSYTLPKMLKLRTGVVRVATGFAKNYGQPIPIVPVGLTYFKKESFRSEMMMEFGTPIMITPEDVATDAFKTDEKGEVKRMTDQLETRMHQLTLNASDFTTIRDARVMRRLYLNTAASIDANKDVHLTQQIITMLEDGHGGDEDKKRRIEATRQKVAKYKDALDSLRIKDQDIVEPVGRDSLTKLFFERILFLLVLLPLGTPGLLVNSPFYFLGKKLNTLAGYVESQSMFKIIVIGILVPIQWLILIIVAWFVGGSNYASILAVCLPLFLYSHIHVLEESRSILESVSFLFNIAAHQDKVDAIRKEREMLVNEVNAVVAECIDPAFLSTIRNSVVEANANSPVHRKAGPLRYRGLSTGDSLLQ